MFLLSFTINVVRRYPFRRILEDKEQKAGRGAGKITIKRSPQNKEIKRKGKGGQELSGTDSFFGGGEYSVFVLFVALSVGKVSSDGVNIT